MPVPLQTEVEGVVSGRDFTHETWTDPSTGKPVEVTIVRNRTLSQHLKQSGRYGLNLKQGQRKHSLDPLEQLYVRAEDHYMQYPQTNRLRILYMDIEVVTEGRALFPKPDSSTILMIGYAIDDGPVEIITVGNDPHDDRGLCERWIQLVKETDPDLIVAYNGRKFDLPFIKGRCLKHGLDLAPLHRLDFVPYQVGRDNWRPEGDRYDGTYAGRVEFDVYADGVALDMGPQMMGLPNRKMKTVAYAYDIAVGEDLDDAELRDTLSVWNDPDGRDRFRRYLESDVRITREISRIYLPNLIALAELNQLPLDAVVNTYKSFIPKLIHARHFDQRKFTAFESNFRRYNPNTGSVHKLGTPDDEEKIPIEGGYVAIRKTGRFSPVWKIDVQSFYPSMMRTLHLSPETVRVLKTLPYKGEYRFKRDDEKRCLYLSAPDQKIDRQIIIGIDLTREGFLVEDIRRTQEDRLRLKAEARKAIKGSQEQKILQAQDNARKIILNSVYGLEAEKHTEYGSYPIAITTTAMCRWLIQHVQDWLGDAVIAVDTDGLFVDGEVDVEDINSRIADLMMETIGEPGCVRMDLEGPWDAGCFYKKKQYILLKDGKVSLHGSGFKSSSMCAGVRRFINKVAELQLTYAPRSAYREMMKNEGDPLTWEFEDFIMTFRYGRDAFDYGSWASIGPTLGEQVKYLEGSLPVKGDTVEYLHTNVIWHARRDDVGPLYSQSKQVMTIRPLYHENSGINYSKYIDIVMDVLERFDIDRDKIFAGNIFALSGLPEIGPFGPEEV